MWLIEDTILTSTAAAAAGIRLIDVNSAQAVANLASNYNDLFLVNAAGNFIGRGNGVDYATLVAWQAGVAKDANSISADPLFSSIGTGALDIAYNSPARGAGTAVAAVPQDINDQARPTPPSMGAYEPLAAWSSGGTLIGQWFEELE